MKAKNYIIGFLAGGAAGCLLGMLFAPKSGRELRTAIRRKSENVVEKAKNKYDETLRRMEGVVKPIEDQCAAKEDQLASHIEAAP